MSDTPYVKKMFPGGNTSVGFYSYFRYIVPAAQAARIIILKGGPGVGKSSFMRGIAKGMLENGYNVELHYCSSDPGSLDAVCFPDLNIALLDGTAPHLTDPRFPGAVDEIINLGHWNETNLRKNRSKIVSTTNRISEFFQSAYRYLAAAKSIHDDWEMQITPHQDFAWTNQIASNLERKVFRDTPVASTIGTERHLFGSAITPRGPMEYFDSLIGLMERKILIKGQPGTGKSTLLEKIARAGLERGYKVEYYHNPLVPDKVDHILIPELNTAIATSNELFTYSASDIDQVFDLDNGLDQAALSEKAEYIEQNKTTFFQLFNQAIALLKQAMQLHDRLEELYVPNMQFDIIEKLRDETLERILAYAKPEVPDK